MSQKIYCFCDVITTESKKAYSYIAKDIDVKVGDLVNVPFGYDDGIVQGEIVLIDYYTEQTAPYEVSYTKYILSKATHITDVEEGIVENGLRMNESRTILYGLTTSKEKLNDANINYSNLIIPDGIVEIVDGAFKNVELLEGVTLPEGLKRVGNHAFDNTSITKVKLPSGLEDMGICAFTYASRPYDNLRHARISIEKGNKKYWTDGKSVFGLLEDGSEELLACFTSRLDEYIVPDKVTTIREKAFMGCSYVHSIVLSSRLLMLENDAFLDCNFKSMHIPASVREISNLALQTYKVKDRTFDTKLTVDASSKYYFSDDSGIYEYTEGGCTLLRCTPEDSLVTLNEKTTSIASFAFSGMNKIKEVSVPPALKNIDSFAFVECSRLSKISITGVPEIAATDLNLPSGVETITDGTFSACDFRRIVFPNHIRDISGSAFRRNLKLKRVTLPAMLEFLAIFDERPDYLSKEDEKWMSSYCDERPNAFGGCNALEKVEIPKENNLYATKGGVLYDKSMKILLYVPSAMSAEEYVVSDTVTAIGPAFTNCEKIKKVVLPDGLKRIGNNSFKGSSIAEIVVPPSITEISDEAFSNPGKKIIIYGMQGSFIETFMKKMHGGQKSRTFVGINIPKKSAKPKQLFKYRIDNNTVTITGYTGNGKEVLIASEIEGFPVRKIGKGAFLENEIITHILLPDSVTTIGKNAFKMCSNLKSIELPANLEIVEEGAFSYCSHLEEIKLPATVKFLGKSAFLNCHMITAINIPAGVKVLHDGLFSWCTSLRIVNISEGVERIEEDVFTWCHELSEVTMPDSIKYISESWLGGGSTEEDRYKWGNNKAVVFYVNKNSYAHMFINDFIEASKSYNHNISDLFVILLEKKEPIIQLENQSAFSPTDFNYRFLDGDDYVKFGIDKPENKKGAHISGIVGPDARGYIAFPNFLAGEPVVYIDVHNYPRFNTEGKGDVLKVFIPESVQAIHALPATVQEIIVDENNPHISTDGKGIMNKDGTVFRKLFNRNNPSYSIPDTVHTIEKYAFRLHPELESITIPPSVKKIGDYAFDNCKNLITIDGAENLEEVGSNVFTPTAWWEKDQIFASKTTLIRAKVKEEVLRVPDGIRIIAPNAVKVRRGSPTNLKEVILPTSLEKIEQYAFEGQLYLTKINIPPQVNYIGRNAFSHCESLLEISLPDGIKHIEPQTFNACISLQEVNLPDGLISIAHHAFDACLELRQIKLPKFLEICENPFPYSSVTSPSWSHPMHTGEIKLERITVDPDNKHYCDIDGVFYSKDGKTLIYFPCSYNASEYHIPEGTETIQAYAFESALNVEKVYFPDSVTQIQNRSFEVCKKLQEVCLSANLKEIGESCFRNCRSLQVVHLPKNLTVIQEHCFMGSGLEQLNLPETLEEIGMYAFAVTKLKKVTVPRSVLRIGSAAFAKTYEITVYDTIEPDLQPVPTEIYSAGEAPGPSMSIGWIGVHWVVVNAKFGSDKYGGWLDHWIVVKSANTDEIKYKVWMGIRNEPLDIQNILSHGWGKNAGFAFPLLDRHFNDMKSPRNKVKTAISRLEYAYELSDEAQQMYLSYLKRTSTRVVQDLIDEGDLETIVKIEPYKLLTKKNIDKVIEHARKENMEEITSYLLDYKNREFSKK